MTIEKRKFSRINYQVPLIYEDKDEVYLGKINNISLHGIELREFPHFPQSKIFRISFPLANINDLKAVSEAGLEAFVMDSGNAPKKVSVYLELMRKKWDPNQLKSKGSIIGGRFTNESTEFANSIASFFEHYEENVMFVVELLNEKPFLCKKTWFKTLLSWLGIPQIEDDEQNFFFVKRYLEQEFTNL